MQAALPVSLAQGAVPAATLILMAHVNTTACVAVSRLQTRGGKFRANRVANNSHNIIVQEQRCARHATNATIIRISVCTMQQDIM